MPSVIFLRFAYIQYGGILVIDQLQGGRQIDVLDAAKTISKKGPQQHDATEQGDENWKNVITDELHVHAPFLFDLRILTEAKSARGLSPPNAPTEDAHPRCGDTTKWLPPTFA